LIDYEQFCGMPSFDEHATENVAEAFAETVAANGACQPSLVKALSVNETVDSTYRYPL